MQVTKYMTHAGKEFRNGSVPSNIHHHVQEVIPLLEVSDASPVNFGLFIGSQGPYAPQSSRKLPK